MADVRHLTTRRTGDAYEVMFLVGDDALTLPGLSRLALGVVPPTSQQAYGYVCVVGERLFPNAEGMPARYMVVIDEADDPAMGPLFTKLVTLKDQYLAEIVAVSASPKETRDAIQGIEGLTHYRKDRIEQECRALWPTFVSTSTVAWVRDYTVSDSMYADLNVWMTTNAQDPKTGYPLLDAKARAIPSLFVIRELHTQTASAGLQQGDKAPEVCAALWLACKSLWTTTPRPRKPMVTLEQTRKTGTGY